VGSHFKICRRQDGDRSCAENEDLPSVGRGSSPELVTPIKQSRTCGAVTVNTSAFFPNERVLALTLFALRGPFGEPFVVCD
jgi:hypothetical protein